jgi:hypothetical protein
MKLLGSGQIPKYLHLKTCKQALESLKFILAVKHRIQALLLNHLKALAMFLHIAVLLML